MTVMIRCCVLGAVLLSGCVVSVGHNPSKPWYHKLEAKNPQCVESLKTVPCQNFVDETMRMRNQALQVLNHPEAGTLDEGNIRFLRTLVEITNENLADVGACQP